MDEIVRRIAKENGFTYESVEKSKRTTTTARVVATPKRFYNPEQPGLLNLRELAGNPILEWPVYVPPFDPRGVDSAANYECWKKATESRIGIAGNYFSFKSGTMLACHSHLEERLFRYFEMCPFVVEIRTQYPGWDREDFIRKYERGQRIRKNDILTVDFMLTLKLPDYDRLIYHGVSGKPSGLLNQKHVIRRHEREVSRLAALAGSHEVMTELTIPEREFRNYEILFSYMKYAESHDLASAHEKCESLAYELMKTSAVGTLDKVLTRCATRCGLKSEAYRIFGIAHFLGYLRWDHEYVVARYEPLKLMRT